MHVPKTFNDAIAQGFCVGLLSQVQDRMRIAISNYLKRKFLDAMIEAAEKPLGPAELGDLLTEILSGRK